MSTAVPNVREIKNKLIQGIRSGACSFHDHARWKDSILDFIFFFLLRSNLNLFWTLNASLSDILHISFIPDIDECSSAANECHQNASCHNTKGSYNCTCKDGFEGDGKNCSGKILFRAQLQRAQLQKKNLQKWKSILNFLFIFCYHSYCMRMILAVSLGPTQGPE
mgnify:CR=1 FL=1